MSTLISNSWEKIDELRKLREFFFAGDEASGKWFLWLTKLICSLWFYCFSSYSWFPFKRPTKDLSSFNPHSFVLLKKKTHEKPSKYRYLSHAISGRWPWHTLIAHIYVFLLLFDSSLSVVPNARLFMYENIRGSVLSWIRRKERKKIIKKIRKTAMCVLALWLSTQINTT